MHMEIWNKEYGAKMNTVDQLCVRQNGIKKKEIQRRERKSDRLKQREK